LSTNDGRKASEVGYYRPPHKEEEGDLVTTVKKKSHTKVVVPQKDEEKWSDFI